MTTKSVVDLQDKLITLSLCCKMKKLQVNPDKTVIMKFRKSGRSKREKELKFNDVVLKYVGKYTYLGVVFSQSGSFKYTLENALTKGKSALSAIWHTSRVGNHINWDAARKLFEATVLSTVLDGSSIWGLNYTEEIEKI